MESKEFGLRNRILITRKWFWVKRHKYKQTKNQLTNQPTKQTLEGNACYLYYSHL